MNQFSADIDALVARMSFTEKVGQLNQRLLGWKALRRNAAGKLVASDALKREIDRWGGLGLLYGLLRADPWSGRDWDNGISPRERLEAVATVQSTVLTRGAHGIGTLFSEEAPHGHQALGATALPANLALGATFDPETVLLAERAVAMELAASGIHIALVSGLDIARDPRWGRCEECFGEDPLLASNMCTAIVNGMQGEHRSRIGHGGVAVVMKHLAAQGEAVGGRNAQSAVIGYHDLQEIHLPPVEAAVRSGAMGFMAAYNDIDSIPCCANPWLLTTYLRGRLGFDGVVMADGLAVDRLEPMTGSIREAGRRALLAGVDVSLWDRGFAALTAYEHDEEVVASVDAAVVRVLELKAMFGLLPSMGVERKLLPTDGNDLIRASVECRKQSRILARESLTLLKATGSRQDKTSLMMCDVPRLLSARGCGKVVVAGPLADDCGCFLGDYVAPLRKEERSSIYHELRERYGTCRIKLARDIDDFDSVEWRRASLIVFVCGGTSERSYNDDFEDNGAVRTVAEYGATSGEGIDLSDIRLPWCQDELLDDISSRTSAPIISIVVCGRAHVLTHVLRLSDIVVWAGYAGPFGPRVVVDALAGADIPGRLPVTLPTHPMTIPVRYNDRQPAEHMYKDASDPVLRPFGYGEGSLCDIVISDLSVESDNDAAVMKVSALVQTRDDPVCGSLNLFAHVKGGGRRIPRLLMLVGSSFMTLPAHERKTVTFLVPFGMVLDDSEDAAHVDFFIGDAHASV